MKRHVTLSGNQMTSKETMHPYLSKKLQLPSYYGNNLDALFDCLCEIATPLHITVTYTERLLLQTGSYGEAFLRVLQNASEENEMLQLSLFALSKERIHRQ